MSISPASTSAKIALGLEVAYYTTVVVAVAVGVFGMQGFFGHSFQGFMQQTLQTLPKAEWLILGASIVSMPLIFNLAVKTQKSTEKEKTLLAGRQRIQQANKTIERNPPPPASIGEDILGFTSEAYVKAVITLARA